MQQSVERGFVFLESREGKASKGPKQATTLLLLLLTSTPSTRDIKTGSHTRGRPKPARRNTPGGTAPTSPPRSRPRCGGAGPFFATPLCSHSPGVAFPTRPRSHRTYVISIGCRFYQVEIPEGENCRHGRPPYPKDIYLRQTSERLRGSCRDSGARPPRRLKRDNFGVNHPDNNFGNK